MRSFAESSCELCIYIMFTSCLQQVSLNCLGKIPKASRKRVRGKASKNDIVIQKQHAEETLSESKRANKTTVHYVFSQNIIGNYVHVTLHIQTKILLVLGAEVTWQITKAANKVLQKKICFSRSPRKSHRDHFRRRDLKQSCTCLSHPR